MNNNWFFITGNFRSGTTLTKFILNSHPSIRVYDEAFSHSMLDLMPPEILDKRLEEETELILPITVGFKIPYWGGEIKKKWPVWNDKMGVNGKGVYLLRDVRAVISSLKVTLPNYLNSAAQKRLTEIEPIYKLRDKYPEEYSYIDSLESHLSSYAKAALIWRWHLDTYYELKEENKEVLGINYNNLVTLSEAPLRKLTTFLNVPWDDKLLNHPEYTRDRQFFLNNNPSRSIDSQSITKWKEILTDEEVLTVLRVAGELNDKIITE